MRQLVIRGWQFLRAGWLILGISLLFLLVAEGCVRIVREFTGADDTFVPNPDAYASSNWYPDFIKEYKASLTERWLPYVYFGRRPSFHGRYVNVDSLGHRVTPQPATPAVPKARVFFLGGSTMWGTAQRDDHTIPAEASRRLQALAGPGARIDVTNFGESGYVFTQEVLDLILQLRAGARPDVVVFFDGINDVFATVQNEVAGVPQNEANRVTEFDLGRALNRTGSDRGPRRDLRAVGLLGVTASKQLALVAWLQSLMPTRAAVHLSTDSASRSTVSIYAEEVRMVEALSQVYGFTAIYVWQPSLHGTQKKLTQYEERRMATIVNSPFQVRLQAVYRAVPAMLDSAMRTAAPGRFINASALFRNDTATVFVDRIGHNIESSVPEIVDAFWPALQAAIVNRPH